ncbi:unnamed protein product [Thelazia callipaeda]|uniref:Tetraspanin n=1 Tax=Thelazia callipaeda TaxID=103827 RepID=A0A0N5CVP9_THECL|nr:unnamed protein product [Thelazia callipaeda]
MNVKNGQSGQITKIENGCVDITFLRMIIYFFNIVFYISSAAFIGLSIWIYIMKFTMFGSFFGDTNYAKCIILCFIIGFAVFFTASIGHCAIFKRKRSLMLLYLILALLTLLFGLSLCILAYIDIERVEDNLGSSLLMSVIRDYSDKDDISKSLQYLHREGHCCGSQSFEDWRNSIWWQKVNSVANVKQRSFDFAVPEFCCRKEGPECGRRDHPSNIYYDVRYFGCLHYLIKITQQQLLIISGAGVALTIVQVC